MLALLRARTKFDFHCYRKKTLGRRLARRMGLSRFDNVAEYLAHLREHPEEVKRLARDLLVSVTSFFRDPDAFSTLETEVIAPLVQAKDADARCGSGFPAAPPVKRRTPSPCCCSNIRRRPKTPAACKSSPRMSMNTRSTVARRGIYPEGIAADVSPERLARFFTRVNESAWQISKQVRETVTFAAQNLITDAPFSKMDLISCRNILIYLEPEMQKKIITLLHFSLKEGGYLFLGPSETVGRQTDLFEPVSKKWRIYRRIGPARADDLQFPAMQTEPRQAKPQPANRPHAPPRLAELAQQSLLAPVWSGLRCDQPRLRGPALRRADRGLPRSARRPTHPEPAFSGAKPSNPSCASSSAGPSAKTPRRASKA